MAVQRGRGRDGSPNSPSDAVTEPMPAVRVNGSANGTSNGPELMDGGVPWTIGHWGG